MRSKVAAPLLLALAATPAFAQTAQGDLPSLIQVSKNVEFITGDTWKDGGKTFRLYGVQSCLRGTTATAPDGRTVDCGNYSMAQTMAIFQVTPVSCQPVGNARDAATFVICASTMSGTRVDIGTALIAGGYAFSAVYPNGDPVNMDYLVTELTAKGNQSGLWGYQFQHPVQALLAAMPKGQQQEQKP